MAVERYHGNPVLTKDSASFRINSIFNAGAVKFNNRYLLLCRVEMPAGRSSLVLARSENGRDFQLDGTPVLSPEDHGQYAKYTQWGVEDPRITPLDGKFFITYTGYSKYQPLVMLAETEDFEKFRIHGPITEPSNKDAVLFPKKINGYFWKLDRPSAEHRRDIWINRSPDLIHWGGHQFVMTGEKGTWEHNKIGASTPPVKTPEGWLMLYHGVRQLGVSSIYKLGVLLLDLNEPWKVKGKSREPILAPDELYERVGDVGNVVFSCGWIIEDNGDVKIYYSGADQNICLATTSLEYLLSICR